MYIKKNVKTLDVFFFFKCPDIRSVRERFMKGEKI